MFQDSLLIDIGQYLYPLDDKGTQTVNTMFHKF